MAAGTEKPEEDLVKRLNRIEGQVKGLQRMIAEGKPCMEILTQIAAARAALHRVGSLILEQHAMTCMEKAFSSEDRETVLEELSKTMKSFMRFTD